VSWQSWQEFLAMGGHGAYVWAAYAVAAVAVALEFALLELRRRSIVGYLRRLLAAARPR
jgi:heme exporter protein D